MFNPRTGNYFSQACWILHKIGFHLHFAHILHYFWTCLNQFKIELDRDFETWFNSFVHIDLRNWPYYLAFLHNKANSSSTFWKVILFYIVQFPIAYRTYITLWIVKFTHVSNTNVNISIIGWVTKLWQIKMIWKPHSLLFGHISCITFCTMKRSMYAISLNSHTRIKSY